MKEWLRCIEVVRAGFCRLLPADVDPAPVLVFVRCLGLQVLVRSSRTGMQSFGVPIAMAALLLGVSLQAMAAEQTHTGSPINPATPANRTVDQEDEHFELPEPLLGAEGARPIEEDLHALKQQRFQELRRQLDELSRLLPAEAIPHAATPVIVPPVLPREAALEEIPAPYMQTPPVQLQPVPEAQPAAPHAAEEPAPGHDATHDAITSMAPHSSAELVSGPIDRFSLAVSLFGSHQWDVCLSVLESLQLDQLPREDQIWSQYMKACCHRHCGSLDEAQRLYRRVLAETDAGWVAELARWWLDNLEEKKRLQQDAQRLAETLKAWETEIGILSAQPR